MFSKLKAAILDSVPEALFIGGSAALGFIITSLLHRPDLAPYYGVLNMALVILTKVGK